MLTNMENEKKKIFETLLKEKDEIFQLNWVLPSPEIQQLIDDTNNSSAKSPAVNLAPAIKSAPAKSAPAKLATIPKISSSICKLINDYDKMIKK